MKKFEKATVGEKVASYVEMRRTMLVAVLAVLVVAIASFALITGIRSKNSMKGISALDLISYEMTSDSSGLSEEELAERKQKVLSSIEQYTKKSGVVGVRANMLSAEIFYSDKEYAKAADSWVAAFSKGKKSYTASIAAFNAASCYENLGDFSNAEKYYSESVKLSDFLLAGRANFNLGRVREKLGNIDGALEAYNAVIDSEPDSSWGKPSKTQTIKLELK